MISTVISHGRRSIVLPVSARTDSYPGAWLSVSQENQLRIDMDRCSCAICSPETFKNQSWTWESVV